MPIARNRPSLVLWDIDHTLIETRGTGGQFAKAAFHAVTGVIPERMAVATGKTEPMILAETLHAHGIAPTEDHQRQYAVALPEQYRLHANVLRQAGRALPGAGKAITALSRLEGINQTVLTGNYRAVAMIKLATFHLDSFLDLEVGAYADDSADRTSLVRIAQHRSGDKYASEFTRRNTIVIGDTTQDVTAALRGGAGVIAVASGKESSEDLRAAGAPVVLDSLQDTEDVLRAINQALG